MFRNDRTWTWSPCREYESPVTTEAKAEDGVETTRPMKRPGCLPQELRGWTQDGLAGKDQQREGGLFAANDSPVLPGTAPQSTLKGPGSNSDKATASSSSTGFCQASLLSLGSLRHREALRMPQTYVLLWDDVISVSQVGGSWRGRLVNNAFQTSCAQTWGCSRKSQEYLTSGAEQLLIKPSFF